MVAFFGPYCTSLIYSFNLLNNGTISSLSDLRNTSYRHIHILKVFLHSDGLDPLVSLLNQGFMGFYAVFWDIFPN
jgi:hypothetical protein